jgi:SAM-dependent methyltransferase
LNVSIRTFNVLDVNDNHELCSSPEWAEGLKISVLIPLSTGLELGDVMLEVGPGPGAATGWLRQRVKRLVAVELDATAAATLANSYQGTNVEVVVGDASSIDCPDDSFDSAGCFTMLHHVSSTARQNRILAEIMRVLRPGGVFIGSDSIASDGLHHFHEGDVYNPIDPGSLYTRLTTVGFTRVSVMVDDHLNFVAYKPMEMATT